MGVDDSEMDFTPDKLSAISIFSGAGGMDIGVRQAGFDIMACLELDPNCCETLRENIRREGFNTKVYEGDIRKFNPYEILSDLNLQEGQIDLLFGGPPCQAYSIHGRATDRDSMQNDYRNYLFESFCKVVDAFRPDLFVFENVGGLLSAKPGGIPVRKRIYDAFTQIGYKIRTPDEMPTALYDAANFNVPQHRPRVIILGTRNDTELNLDDLYAAIDKEKNLKVK